jgi:ribosomal protein L32
MTDTARDRLRMHLTQAATRTDDADVRAHLTAALGALDELPATPLVECPVCGRVGLPERIAAHDC